MGKTIIIKIKRIIKREFYKEYGIEEDNESKFIVDGGIVSEKSPVKKRKKKKYCATNYMDVDWDNNDNSDIED